MIALALLLQAGWTVGDTIWVERTVRLPERRTVRASDWQLSGDVELLGPPRLVFRDGSAEIAYPLVAWRPGVHAVDVPGPVLVASDGSIDSLPAERVTLEVASVLPDVPPDSTLRPQPPAQIVARRSESSGPLLALWLLAALLLAPLHLWWRRRGSAPPFPAPAPLPAPPIGCWIDAGEHRAALGLGATRLRSLISERVGDHSGHPDAEVGTLLDAMDAARFAPLPAAQARELLERAQSLETRLSAGLLRPAA